MILGGHDVACTCGYSRKYHSTIDEATNNWMKVCLKNSFTDDCQHHQHYVYMAPDGTIFKSLMQIKYYFVIMSGISLGLDYLLNKIELLPVVNVVDQAQLEELRTTVAHQMNVYFARTFGGHEDDFNEFKERENNHVTSTAQDEQVFLLPLH